MQFIWPVFRRVRGESVVERAMDDVLGRDGAFHAAFSFRRLIAPHPLETERRPSLWRRLASLLTTLRALELHLDTIMLIKGRGACADHGRDARDRRDVRTFVVNAADAQKDLVRPEELARELAGAADLARATSQQVWSGHRVAGTQELKAPSTSTPSPAGVSS